MNILEKIWRGGPKKNGNQDLLSGEGKVQDVGAAIKEVKKGMLEIDNDLSDKSQRLKRLRMEKDVVPRLENKNPEEDKIEEAMGDLAVKRQNLKEKLSLLEEKQRHDEEKL